MGARGHAYEGEADLCRLAAAYAGGIVRNHPFVDGNKRAALAAAGVFLMLNGPNLIGDKAEATVAMLDLAAGELPEEGFAAWLRDNTTPRG
jgi:death-on-curing protein